MDFLLQYYEILITLLVAVFGIVKWVAAVKYAEFFKELVDVVGSYKKGNEDKVFTDQEKIALANEVIEAIKKGEETFKKKKLLKK